MNDETPSDYNDRLLQLSNFLTYRISRVHGKLNAQASKILHDTVGLPLNQWRVIAFIGGAGTISASELIRFTAMDKGLVSRNVKALLERGLLMSSPDKFDNRVHVLSLTEAGQAVFDTALPRMRRRQTKLRENLTDEDIATFRKVIAALEIAAEDTDP